MTMKSAVDEYRTMLAVVSAQRSLTSSEKVILELSDRLSEVERGDNAQREVNRLHARRIAALEATLGRRLSEVVCRLNSVDREYDFQVEYLKARIAALEATINREGGEATERGASDDSEDRGRRERERTTDSDGTPPPVASGASSSDGAPEEPNICIYCEQPIMGNEHSIALGAHLPCIGLHVGLWPLVPAAAPEEDEKLVGWDQAWKQYIAAVGAYRKAALQFSPESRFQAAGPSRLSIASAELDDAVLALTRLREPQREPEGELLDRIMEVVEEGLDHLELHNEPGRWGDARRIVQRGLTAILHAPVSSTEGGEG